MGDRFIGILLFLPVPLVLWLFTRAPFGVGRSLAAGIVVMAVHRFVARPFALSRASRRCLWCGGPANRPIPVRVADPAGTVGWHACAPAHHDRLSATLGWVSQHRRFVAAGVGGAILTFLPFAWLAEAGLLGSLDYRDAVAWFKGLVAVTVLPIGWIAPRRAGRGPAELRLPFPAHIQALVGTLVVVWLFRLVGALWLVEAVTHLVRQ